MDIQDNIKPVRSLMDPLQFAMDNGAKKALSPSAKRQSLFEVAEEGLEKLDPIRDLFFSSARASCCEVQALLLP